MSAVAARSEFDSFPSDAELIRRWAERSAAAGILDIRCTPAEWRAVVEVASCPDFGRPMPGPARDPNVVWVTAGSQSVTFRPPGG